MQISWRGGGWGGRSPPTSSTPDPKVSSSCLLACLLAFLFGFFSAKRFLLCKANKWKKQKEKGEQLPKQKSNKSKEQKDKNTKSRKATKATKAAKAAEAEKQQKQKNKTQKQKSNKSKKHQNQNQTKTKTIPKNINNAPPLTFCLLLFNSILHFPCGPSFVTLFLRLPCFHPSCLPHFLP